MTGTTTTARTASLVVAVVAAKAVLMAMLVLVLVDPAWGNLEGKAPNARAFLYPSVALVVPVYRALRPSDTPYPWLSDLLLTMTGFTDIVGNRLDLYDAVWWFDDVVHLLVTMFVSAAFVLLTLDRTTSAVAVLDRALAAGMTAAIGWELFEFISFVTRNKEVSTAYADTIGDLVMDWLGALLAAWLVHTSWRHHLPSEGDRPLAVLGAGGVARDQSRTVGMS